MCMLTCHLQWLFNKFMMVINWIVTVCCLSCESTYTHGHLRHFNRRFFCRFSLSLSLFAAWTPEHVFCANRMDFSAAYQSDVICRTHDKVLSKHFMRKKLVIVNKHRIKTQIFSGRFVPEIHQWIILWTQILVHIFITDATNECNGYLFSNMPKKTMEKTIEFFFSQYLRVSAIENVPYREYFSKVLK